MNAQKHSTRAYAFVCIFLVLALAVSGCTLKFQSPIVVVPETTPVPTATSAPINSTVAPEPLVTQPSAPVPVTGSLNYDRGDPDCLNGKDKASDPLVTGQETYVAFYLCQSIEAGTEKAMFDAVGKIQTMASVINATVWTGDSVTIPENQAAVIWCANTTGLVAPNDIAFPLGQEKSTALEYDSPNGLGNVFVLPPIGGGTTRRTFSGCSSPDGFWAVAVH